MEILQLIKTSFIMLYSLRSYNRSNKDPIIKIFIWYFFVLHGDYLYCGRGLHLNYEKLRYYIYLGYITKIRSQTMSLPQLSVFGEATIFIRLPLVQVLHINESCAGDGPCNSPFAIRVTKYPTLRRANFGVMSRIYERFVSKSQGPPTKHFSHGSVSPKRTYGRESWNAHLFIESRVISPVCSELFMHDGRSERKTRSPRLYRWGSLCFNSDEKISGGRTYFCARPSTIFRHDTLSEIFICPVKLSLILFWILLRKFIPFISNTVFFFCITTANLEYNPN